MDKVLSFFTPKRSRHRMKTTGNAYVNRPVICGIGSYNHPRSSLIYPLLISKGLKMAARTRQKPFFYFAAWTLLGTISILIGFALLRLLVPPASGKVNLVVETILGVLGFGILLPLVQWIVLSRFLSNAYWWLIASFTSLLLGLSIDLLVTRWITYPIPGAFSIGMSTAFGLITGTAQWAYLRHHFSKATIWIFASALGWGLTSIAAGTVIDSFFAQVLFGLIPALFTGSALFYLMSASPHQSSDGLSGIS